jgi:predicted metal-dependent phosphoesterase TrpH
MYCDLHVHSHFSDGTWSPEELVAEAERLGLDAVALCDHNTVAGVPQFMAAGQGSSVQTVAGIEFSTDFQGTELHILALFVQPEHYDTINAMMEDWKKKKEQSNIDLVAALNRAGYDISYAEIREKGNGYINRAHIAAELTKKGYTESAQDAFKKLLNPSKGFYQPPEKLLAYDIIRFIKSIGAVAVLAHPFLNLDEAGLRSFLPKAVACGLDGMEVLYPKYKPEQTVLAERIAEEFGILGSGGSDFHGDNKPDIAMGSGRGTLAVPTEYLLKLRQRAKL